MDNLTPEQQATLLQQQQGEIQQQQQQLELQEQEIRRQGRLLQQQRVGSGDGDNRRQFQKDVRVWVNEQSEHVTSCDGGNVRNIRDWVKSVRQANLRAPQCQEQEKEEYIKKLIFKTTRGDLFDEIEQYLNSVDVDRDLCGHEDILQHVISAFLPDEADNLKDELRKARQGQREELLNFNRRFYTAARAAYPHPSLDEQETMTRLYIANVKRGKIQQQLLDTKPRLRTLDRAQEVAMEAQSDLRWKEKTMRAAASEEEPMEVDALTIREQVSQQQQEIRQLKKQLDAAKLKSTTTAPTREFPSRKPNTDNTAKRRSTSDVCRFCKEVGHWVKDCPKNKAYWEKKGGTRRPLPPQERSVDF